MIALDQSQDAAALIAKRSEGLAGVAIMPGDKSISHRALILAAMAEGTSRIVGLSDADDVGRTLAAIEALGATVQQDGGDVLVTGGPWRSPDRPIDCGNSGTTARLLLGALAGRGSTATLTGDASLSRRPMARVVEPLRLRGARIDGGDTLPLALAGGALRPIVHRNRPTSAQVKSALLLAGLGAGVAVEIEEAQPTRDHLERMLPAFGVAIESGASETGIRLPADARPRAAAVQVPGDTSAGAFPLVAALLCPESEVALPNVGTNPYRTGLLSALKGMGADIRIEAQGFAGNEPVATIIARSSRLRGVTVLADSVPSMIDEYPILAIAAACAQGETVMHGLAELRVKESDRLAAIVEGLVACGVRARAEGDTLRVVGGPVPGGATIDAAGDHRIAMAFLVLGLVSQSPIRVNGADMIATSFPGFAETMRGLGAGIGAP